MHAVPLRLVHAARAMDRLGAGVRLRVVRAAVASSWRRWASGTRANLKNAAFGVLVVACLNRGFMGVPRDALANQQPWAVTLQAPLAASEAHLSWSPAQVVKVPAGFASPIARYTIGAAPRWVGHQA